jgi:putative addiction module component (TIGR02574 family)
MSKTEILEQIRRLPEQERREFTEQFFEEFGYFADELSPGQAVELERRAEELRFHPERGIPWEQLKAELHDRLKSRKA